MKTAANVHSKLMTPHNCNKAIPGPATTPRPTKAELVEQREQVRMLAMQIGYRAAARECGLSEDRVRQWAHRYGWSLPHKLARTEDALSPSVTRPAEALQKRLQHDNESTRLSLSTAVRKGAAALAERDGEDVLNVSRRMKDVVDSASTLHGWNDKQAASLVDIHVSIEKDQARARELWAEVERLKTSEEREGSG